MKVDMTGVKTCWELTTKGGGLACAKVEFDGDVENPFHWEFYRSRFPTYYRSRAGVLRAMTNFGYEPYKLDLLKFIQEMAHTNRMYFLRLSKAQYRPAGDAAGTVVEPAGDAAGTVAGMVTNNGEAIPLLTEQDKNGNEQRSN